jgi:hypothetical protein
MKHISSSPIFIVIGDRGRAPVTGNTTATKSVPLTTSASPTPAGYFPTSPTTYGSYPPIRYIPAYNKSTSSHHRRRQRAASASSIRPRPRASTPPPSTPTTHSSPTPSHVPFAKVRNIVIRNVVVEDADPRYPILLSGLVDHPIENVSISNVTVTYRGGLTMDDATEQRQINDTLHLHPYQAPPQRSRSPGSQHLLRQE